MHQSQQNRKLILQQLLQKSEIFAHYIKDESTLTSLLIQKRKNQPVQFGKCQINLPQRVKQQGKFLCNKLMVLTKSKKQAQKMKEKFDYLQKLRQTECDQKKSVSSCYERSERSGSKYQDNIRSSKQIETQWQNLQNYHSNSNSSPQSQLYFSPQYQTFSPKKQHNFQFIRKKRSISAKARTNIIPQLNKGQGIQLQKSQSTQSRKKILDQQLKQKTTNSKKLVQLADRQQQKTSLTNVTEIVMKERAKNKIPPTQCQQQSVTQRNEVSEPEDLLLGQRQSFLEKPQLSEDMQLLMLDPKRSTSFSVKRHPVTSITPTLLINKNYQQLQQQQKKNKINLRRQLHKTYKRAFVAPPKISAKAYTIYEMKRQGDKQSGKILHAMNGKMGQEVASLTKIMTCVIVLQISEKYQRRLEEEIVQIGRFETGITGTSAQIKIGQMYTLEQLLYGLMLPSGNDASLALGVWGGRVLLEEQLKDQANSEKFNPSFPLFIQGKKITKRDCIQRFILQMNTKAQQLQMTRTNYANTHGLVNSDNKSSAIDIALLCEYAMSNETFARIVTTTQYVSKITYKDVPTQRDQNINPSTQQSSMPTRQIVYQNTHYLLHKRPDEYIGIKTGVTTIAGPCLASCVLNKETGRKFIIVVLNCKSMLERFRETQILKRWLYKQQNIKYKKIKKTFTSNKEQKSSYSDENNPQSEEDQFSCDDKCDQRD